ncbi:MAG: hypothetical protein FWC60_07145, partial [Firmicutes bacterium]|nr:hypothetical protein [Bacillota bacterium]
MSKRMNKKRLKLYGAIVLACGIIFTLCLVYLSTGTYCDEQLSGAADTVAADNADNIVANPVTDSVAADTYAAAADTVAADTYAAAPGSQAPLAEAADAAGLAEQEFTATVYTDATLTSLASDETVLVRGELPVGGYAVAYPVELSLDMGDVLAAYDIKVYCADGTEFTVDGSVTVSIGLPDLPADLDSEKLSLVYIPENGEPQTLDTPVSVTDTGVSFDVEHFSVYAVTVTNLTNGLSYSLDGGPTVTVPVTRVGTTSQYTASISDAINSQYLGQVHSVTFSGTNTGFRIAVTQDGASLTAATPLPYTVNFTATTKIVAVFTNPGSNTNQLTLTMNINVASIGIKDDIVNQGLLTAVETSALPSPIASYTWYKSANKSTNQDGSFIAPTLVDSTLALSTDGTSVNVALDNGAQMWYEVAATLEDGTTVYSAPYQVPYYKSIQNGSFENPTGTSAAVSSNGNFANFVNGTPGLIWKTTAQDERIEICLNPSTYNLNPPRVPDGIRFAELNANYVGTLYQDVLVAPGQTLYWSLDHAGRSGADTMDVVIMPTKEVNLASIPTASDDANGIQVTQITDGNVTWNSNNNGQKYSGSYTVPDGTYVVRFFFVSVSAAGGNNTFGNLLDDVTFATNLPYRVEYYLDGVRQNISESGQDDSIVQIYAQHTDQFANYFLQKTQLTYSGSNAVLDLNRATDFTLMVPNTVFKLYYISSGLIVNKTVDGVRPADMPDTYEVTFNLYAGADATTEPVATGVVTITNGSVSGSIQFMTGSGTPYNLTPGTTYTVVEDPSFQATDIPLYAYDHTAISQVTVMSQAAGGHETAVSQQSAGEMSVTFTAASATTSIYKASFKNCYLPTGANFAFTKVGDDEVTPLPGVKFKLYKGDLNDPAPQAATSDNNGLVNFGWL